MINMNSQARSVKRKNSTSFDNDVVAKKIKQEPKEVEVDKDLTIKFEDGANQIKEESLIEALDHTLYQSSALYRRVATAHTETLRVLKDVIQEVGNANCIEKQKKQVFEFLVKFVIKLDDKHVAMKKKIVDLINENPESTDAQKQWVQELEIDDNSDEAKNHRSTMNIIRNFQGF